MRDVEIFLHLAHSLLVFLQPLGIHVRIRDILNDFDNFLMILDSDQSHQTKAVSLLITRFFISAHVNTPVH
jgi:hypothetical protein